MDLYICEKPSQAKDLAQVLRISKRAEGYLHDGGDRMVTWAFGHLLELDMPDAYDPALKSWNMETLPIAPDQWRYHVKKSGAKQFKVIKELLGKANQVFIATDHDREEKPLPGR
ncbi:toprim domain-containing protein [Halomonas sp. E19]|uniref:toprim domain-containing protein n=1 Tax=Halomonas sp. E19 TaxID=3397247 RepID=UPI004033F028